MTSVIDRPAPRKAAPDSEPSDRRGDLVWLTIPSGVVFAVFALEVGALLLAAPQHAVWSDFVLIGLTTIGSGLPATFLGVGSVGVLGVRWPAVEWAVGGVLGVVLLGVLAQQVISGSAIADGATTASGEPSLLFALWVLQWAIPTTVVAFICGRAAAGTRRSTVPKAASSIPR